jgi:hypothetical protein
VTDRRAIGAASWQADRKVPIYLEYRGYCVEVPEGETVVGRDASCTLRFIDSALSRRHLRILREGNTVSVEDLGSTNGTMINLKPLTRRTVLRDRDAIEFAGHQLLLRIISDAEDERSTRRLTSFSALPNARAKRDSLSETTRQTCPRCSTQIARNRRMCPVCGHDLAVARAVSQTIPAPRSADRRRHDRRAVELSVVYSSSELEIEGTTRDLSQSGVFVTSAVFDPPGTACNVTLHADGMAPLVVTGIVRRVVENDGGGEPPGLAVEFLDLDDSARSWIDAAIHRLSRTATMARVDPSEIG